DQPRADDSRASRTLVGRPWRTGGGTSARLAKRQSDGGQPEDGKTEVDQYHTPWRRVVRAQMRGDPEHDETRGEQNPEQPRKIRQAEIAHQHLELAQSPETKKLEADNPGEHEQKSPPGFLWHGKVESKLISQPKTADQ